MHRNIYTIMGNPLWRHLVGYGAPWWRNYELNYDIILQGYDAIRRKMTQYDALAKLRIKLFLLVRIFTSTNFFTSTNLQVQVRGFLQVRVYFYKYEFFL